MNDSVHGIILKQTDYRETGALVKVLTKEHGKLSLSAAGVRRMSSKNAGSLIPCTYGEFLLDYHSGRTLFRLKSAHTLQYWKHMQQDLIQINAAQVLCELSDAMVLEGEDDLLFDQVFDWLYQSMDLLNQGKRADLIIGIFTSKILRASGMAPVVDGCAACGRPSAVTISVKDGGFLCADCARERGIETRPVDFLRAFRLINKADFKDYDILAGCMDNALAQDHILMDFLSEHNGTNIRSYAFFERLFGVE